MMGASKRIMEMFLMRESESMEISTARFANVAFSDGSLLHGFNQRFAKRQPISAPNDVRRYFVTPQESGELCLMSCLLGENRDIFFPKLSEQLHLTTFSDIAERYIENLGYEPYHCSTEQEARDRSDELMLASVGLATFLNQTPQVKKILKNFLQTMKILDMRSFKNLGVIKNEANFNSDILDNFWKWSMNSELKQSGKRHQ